MNTVEYTTGVGFDFQPTKEIHQVPDQDNQIEQTEQEV